jgi:hypothetical protein
MEAGKSKRGERAMGGHGGFGYQAHLEREAARAPKEDAGCGKKGGKESTEDTYESRKAKAMEDAKSGAAAKAAEQKEIARIQQELQNKRVADKKKEVLAAGVKKAQENKRFEEQAYAERKAAEDKAFAERKAAEDRAMAERQAADQRAFEERQRNGG